MFPNAFFWKTETSKSTITAIFTSKKIWIVFPRTKLETQQTTPTSNAEFQTRGNCQRSRKRYCQNWTNPWFDEPNGQAMCEKCKVRRLDLMLVLFEPRTATIQMLNYNPAPCMSKPTVFFFMIHTAKAKFSQKNKTEANLSVRALI